MNFPQFSHFVMPPFRFPHTATKSKFKFNVIMFAIVFFFRWLLLKSFTTVAITFRWCFLFFVFFFLLFLFFDRSFSRSLVPMRREMCVSVRFVFFLSFFAYHLKLFAFVWCILCVVLFVYSNLREHIESKSTRYAIRYEHYGLSITETWHKYTNQHTHNECSLTSTLSEIQKLHNKKLAQCNRIHLMKKRNEKNKNKQTKSQKSRRSLISSLLCFAVIIVTKQNKS